MLLIEMAVRLSEWALRLLGVTGITITYGRDQWNLLRSSVKLLLYFYRMSEFEMGGCVVGFGDSGTRRVV